VLASQFWLSSVMPQYTITDFNGPSKELSVFFVHISSRNTFYYLNRNASSYMNELIGILLCLTVMKFNNLIKITVCVFLLI
jgi:hypothetical protein